ncbi:hypothetical protein GJ698_14935 [Pseudoduganella sp. FT26W]|uniref:Uncharacterized protein n=1 Tax=Duganella aquatilis TaxID=2666082 RepID=A0A844DCR7_9BURK|nr:hypothetical protein [Duganella aquatilis]MRW85379.1 hypothetical protein [Duganella aquatilis]
MNSNTNQPRLQAKHAVNTTLLVSQAKQHAWDIGALAANAEALLEMLHEQIDEITTPDVQRALLRVDALAVGARRSMLLIKEAGKEIEANLEQTEQVAA